MKSNKNVKDSLFVDYFARDEIVGKKNFIALYNLLSGNHLEYGKAAIKDVRLEQVLYKSFYNDISMLVDGRLVVLVEHQSTVNENMPLRSLIYCSRIYEKITKPRMKFSTALKKIPTPEFYVIYNGVYPYPPEKTLKLSDAFMTECEAPPLELKVKVYNIKHPECPLRIDTCKPLESYVKFIDVVEGRRKQRSSAYMDEAIREAEKSGLLPDYLQRKASEVISMVFNEYDYETDIKVKMEDAFEDGHSAGVADGISQGITQGAHDKAVETARNFINLGFNLEQIAQGTGLSLEEVEQIKEAAAK